VTCLSTSLAERDIREERSMGRKTRHLCESQSPRSGTNVDLDAWWGFPRWNEGRCTIQPPAVSGTRLERNQSRTSSRRSYIGAWRATKLSVRAPLDHQECEGLQYRHDQAGPVGCFIRRVVRGCGRIACPADRLE